MSKNPSLVIRDEIVALKAYAVADAAGLIKLDAMENPYGLPAEVRAEISARVADAALNRYPDPHAVALKAQLRNTMQIPADLDLVLGNGSDELIQMLALAVAKPGASMVSCEPSFAMFHMIASFAGLRYAGVPLTNAFALDGPRMLAALQEYRPALLFIAYPNNPSGNLFDIATMESIIEAAPGLVVIDEAYHVFAGRSFLPRLAEFPNLLVMRTLSKLGLAGVRLGLLIGRNEWLRHIDKLRLPYNVSVLTQRVAATVLRHQSVLEMQAATICKERDLLLQKMRRMTSVQVYDSDANFILFRTHHAAHVFGELKARGILVKNLDGAHPLLAGCLRVTIGTPDENTQFFEGLLATQNS